MARILVVGSINMDLVVTTDRIPVVGETVIGKTFKQVAGGKGANQAVAIARRSMIHQGARELVVTLGSRGAMRVTAETISKIGIHPVDVVDTTAAGDSFIGGLVVALSEGRGMDEALEFARAVSALTVSAAGAQTSLPLRSMVDEFMRGLK